MQSLNENDKSNKFLKFFEFDYIIQREEGGRKKNRD